MKAGVDDEPVTARVIKLIERKPATVLGVFRAGPGGGRIEPVDRKQKGLIVDSDGVGKAKEGDLVSVTVTRAGRYGLDRARISEVIGSMQSEKAVSLIAIHAHGIPNVFSPEALAETADARPAPMTDREDWRSLPLVTIDPADARTTTTQSTPSRCDPANPAASSSRSRLPMSPVVCATGLGARPRAMARQLRLFSDASCRCCERISAISARCAEDRRRSPCAWSSPPPAQDRPPLPS
jgi:hypothetical protein